MRRGDFSAAWRLSDAVLRTRARVPCSHLPRHEQYLWNGAAIDGKRVLIRCYHGLGDTIQFIRYAPLVRERAREVVVWAQPALVEILAQASGVDRVLPVHDGSPAVDHDLDVEIMELPHLFRSTLETLPGRVPYLHAFPLPAARDRGASRQCHVGVVWRAGEWDPLRSVPLARLATLAQIPGVTLHALQRGRTLDEWPAVLGPVSGADAVAVYRPGDVLPRPDHFGGQFSRASRRGVGEAGLDVAAHGGGLAMDGRAGG